MATNPADQEKEREKQEKKEQDARSAARRERMSQARHDEVRRLRSEIESILNYHSTSRIPRDDADNDRQAGEFSRDMQRIITAATSSKNKAHNLGDY